LFGGLPVVHASGVGFKPVLFPLHHLASLTAPFFELSDLVQGLFFPTVSQSVL